MAYMWVGRFLKNDMKIKIEQEQNKKSAYELGKDFFSLYDSGLENLSITYKKRLKDKVSEKYFKINHTLQKDKIIVKYT